MGGQVSAEEITQPPAPVAIVSPARAPAPARTVSAAALAEVVTALTGRITKLEGIVDDLIETCEALKKERVGATRVLGQAVLELVKDDAIKSSVAFAIKVVGGAVAVAVIAATGVSFAYGDLSIGGNAPAAINAEQVDAIAPHPHPADPLGTSPVP